MARSSEVGKAVAQETATGDPGPKRAGLALALMVAGQFLVTMDSSIVNVSLPTIQRSLGFSAVGAEGVITAYGTAFGGALMVGGRLADVLGRRRLFAAGLGGFGLTSLLCAFATSPAFLIAARVAQGLSAAMLAPAALALLTTTFAEGKPRNRALGVFGAATSLGFVVGQVLGGSLAATLGWRSVFLVNVPVIALGLGLVKRGLKPDEPSVGRRVPDLLGALLITAAVGLLVWAPGRGAESGWGSVAFVAPLAAALVLLALFGIVETHRRDPLFRLALLKSRWLAGASFTVIVSGALNGAGLLLSTLFLQEVLGFSPLRAGLAFIPTGLLGLLAGVRLASPLINRFGVRMVLTVANLASGGALLGLSMFPHSYLANLPWLMVIGLTFVTAAVATTVASAAGVARNEQGMVAGLRQTSLQIGWALAVAVLLSIAASRTGALLAQGVNRPAALTAGFRLSVEILSGVALAGAVASFTTLRSRSVSVSEKE